MISVVFDFKYLRQNLVNFNVLGVFQNPQDVQIPKLSLDLHFHEDLQEKKGSKVVRSAAVVHCILLLDIKLYNNLYCFQVQKPGVSSY